MVAVIYVIVTVGAQMLVPLRAFLEEFWGDHLDALKATAETMHRARRTRKRATA